MGVAALVRLVTLAGSHMSSSMWQEAVDMVAQAAADTVPQVADLVTPPPRSDCISKLCTPLCYLHLRPPKMLLFTTLLERPRHNLGASH